VSRPFWLTIYAQKVSTCFNINLLTNVGCNCVSFASLRLRRWVSKSWLFLSLERLTASHGIRQLRGRRVWFLKCSFKLVYCLTSVRNAVFRWWQLYYSCTMKGNEGTCFLISRIRCPLIFIQMEQVRIKWRALKKCFSLSQNWLAIQPLVESSTKEPYQFSPCSHTGQSKTSCFETRCGVSSGRQFSVLINLWWLITEGWLGFGLTILRLKQPLA